MKDAAGPFWIPTGHVFTTRDGLPLDPRNFHRAFKARSAKAGVRAIPVHGTRHTCGSLLAALDVHPRVAMQILRHSKIAVTMEIYTHIPVRPHPDSPAPPRGPARSARLNYP
ncbi:MAG TPA: tyrosine-type recombinase/integrase [Dermatophilaceae bacterium]